MQQVIEKCVDGANILEVCEFGDKLMIEETAKVYKKEKEMKKGKKNYLLPSQWHV